MQQNEYEINNTAGKNEAEYSVKMLYSVYLIRYEI